MGSSGDRRRNASWNVRRRSSRAGAQELPARLCHRLCALRAHPPALHKGGPTNRRALRFGDQRAMALAGSLCLVVHAVTGFTNKSLVRHEVARCERTRRREGRLVTSTA